MFAAWAVLTLMLELVPAALTACWRLFEVS